MADFKPINLTYYNPRTSFFKAGKNDRESTAEFVVELVNFRPMALMGGEISDYKKKYVPEFVRQVKIGFPEKYEEALRIQPSVAELAEKVEYKGKKAKLSSLKPGRVKVGIYEVEWDGVRLYGKAREFGVNVEGDLEIRFGEGESEKTVVTIVDEGTVGEETEIE